MTYTVYIPDAERGPTSYTQRQFDTIKALARWAMDAALEEPVVVTPPPASRAPEVAQILADIDAATASYVKKLPDIKDASGRVLAKGSIVIAAPTAENEDPTFKTRSEADRSLRLDGRLPSEPAPEKKALWEVDTDEWFTDVSASEWATPLRERKWADVAKLYFSEIKQLCSEGTSTSREDVLSPEDHAWFSGLAVRYPHLFAENLFPETQVRWDLLPAEFGEACAKHIQTELGTRGATAVHQFAKDAFTLLKFLRTGRRHASWKDISMEVEEGLAWGAAAAPATTEKLLSQWWSGVKPTDAVREFIMRAVVMRYFKQTGEASTVGSQEFLTAYNERVRKMGAEGVLPAGFLDWATRGTSFKHCKAALSFMGIASVRRADGQKYMNLREIKIAEDSPSEVWIFEDDLCDANTYEGFTSVNQWQRIEIVADPHGRG